jgi:hypothetical protein
MAPALSRKHRYLPAEKNSSNAVSGDYRVIFMSS